MEIIGSLMLTLVAGFSTLLGYIFILFKVKNINKLIVISLSFSMTIMILISLIDLLPNGLVTIISKYNRVGWVVAILTFLLGYLFTVLFENKINTNNSLYKVGILSMISLVLHNIPEGIIVFMSSNVNKIIGIKMMSAIMLHNIPEGIIICIPLFYGGVPSKKCLMYLIISALSEPLGALLYYLLLKNFINEIMLSYILIFVSGLMISISINHILKEIINYKSNYMFIGIILGVVLFIITLFI